MPPGQEERFMAAPSTLAGGYPQTFPRKAQPVAKQGSSADRSQRSQRLRLVNPAARALLGDSFVRACPVLTLLAASLIALAPVHALAQEAEESVSVRERPRPEYDPLGMRFGGFDLHASLDLGVAHTDNLFAEETGEDDDTIFTAALTGRLDSTWSRHALRFEAGAATVSHDDFSSEDYDTSFAGVSGRLDVGSRSNLAARARFAHEVESRRDPDAPSQGTPLVEYDRTELGVAAQHTFNRVRVSGGVSQLQHEYDGAQSFRDFDETALTGRVEAALTPRIGLLVEATTDERDYDNTPVLSSEGQTYLVGATVRLTDLMQGEVAVGHFERDYDFGSSTDGLAASANLEWYITRLTTITFTAHRNSEDVVGATTAVPFIESRYGLRVDHELQRNLILTAGGEAGARDYDLIARDDEFFLADLGADYLINRRFVVRGRYEIVQVNSNLAGADFDENRLSFGLGIRL
jgi:hypothetical protein